MPPLKRWFRLPLAGLIALGCLNPLTPPPAIHAAGVIIRVTPAGAASGACGDTWATACDLQYALTSVATAGDELWVAAGVYSPTPSADRTISFQLRSDIALYGGFAMTETARAERNWTANVTTLSGDIGVSGDSSDNSYHVVVGSGTDATAGLDGFTITGGYAHGSTPYERGGGMHTDNGSPTLSNVIFTGNSAYEGGGMNNDNTSQPTLTNVTFITNTASGGWGGGMLNRNSHPSLTQVGFYNNTANNVGGGLYNANGSHPNIQNTIFSGNSAVYGGGLANQSNSQPALTNVTFQGNSAVYGGGLYNDTSQPQLTQITFSNNSASTYGGGILSQNSTLTVHNSLFWANTAPFGPQIRIDTGGVLTITDSVVQDGWIAGSRIITVDPLLGPLDNYGGATATLPLLPGSSAIDAGNPVYCPAADQRSIARPQGGGCDIGAFESRGFTLTLVRGDRQSAPINRNFAIPLSLTVTSAYNEPTQNGRVTLTAPASGASLMSGPTFTNYILNNTVSRAITANGFTGTYVVTVTVAGATSAVYNLKNREPLLRVKPAGATEYTCGATWATACDLQYTLATLAQTNDEIWVAGGIYTPTASANRTSTFTLPTSQLALYGGFAGTETARAERNWTANVTILSGDIGVPGDTSDNADYVVINTADNNQLDGFTITAAITAGLYNGGSHLTLNHNSFSSNVGAGLIHLGNSLTLSNSIVSYNAGSGISGGANANFTLSNCTVSHNGLAGISTYAWTYYDTIYGAITNVTFSDNAGGGIQATFTCLNLTNVTFSHNMAAQGGGLQLSDCGATLTNVTFVGNSAEKGGGAYVNQESALGSSILTMTNTTFMDNSASVQGGGVFVKDNFLVSGHNLILWGNAAPTGTQIAGYMYIADSVVQDGFELGTDILTADPRLGSLGNYGGDTPTVPLLPGSSAIDTGNPAYCPATDQRGIARPQGDGCDMGAYEAAGYTYLYLPLILRP